MNDPGDRWLQPQRAAQDLCPLSHNSKGGGEKYNSEGAIIVVRVSQRGSEGVCVRSFQH